MQNLKNFDKNLPEETIFSKNNFVLRSTIKTITGFGATIATFVNPFDSIFSQLFESNNNRLDNACDLILKVKLLQCVFYENGLNSSNLIPKETYRDIKEIALRKKSDVDYLNSILQKRYIFAKASHVNENIYDFTCNNSYPSVFRNYDSFLAMANGLEDLCVRTVKGQIRSFSNDRKILCDLLKIHTIDAYCAAKVRQLRIARGGSAGHFSPWISTNSKANGKSLSNPEDYLDAFDEPLHSNDVLRLLKSFNLA